MRSFVFGLVLGALIIQTSQSLPLFPWFVPWHVIFASLLLALLALGPNAPRTFNKRWCGVVLWILSGLLLGLGYAHHRADVRLAAELPAAWEGRDIDIIGVVHGLPTLTERGTRFLIRVESIHTPTAILPAAIQLNWYIETNRKTAEVTPPPEMMAGE